MSIAYRVIEDCLIKVFNGAFSGELVKINFKENDVFLEIEEAKEFNNSDQYYHTVRHILNLGHTDHILSTKYFIVRKYIYGHLLPKKLLEPFTNLEIKLPFRALPILLKETSLDQEIIKWRLEKGC